MIRTASAKRSSDSTECSGTVLLAASCASLTILPNSSLTTFSLPLICPATSETVDTPPRKTAPGANPATNELSKPDLNSSVDISGM